MDLVCVGTGIRVVGQITTETIAWMRRADKLLYALYDPVAEHFVRGLNPEGAESLAPLYEEGKNRNDTYEEMAQRILECVRAGMMTCFVTYGHPGVFVKASHESIRRARRAGFKATMLPAISAEDCLVADLGIDPAVTGRQSYGATDFILHRRNIDPTSALVLWQIGTVGDVVFKLGENDLRGLPSLVRRLLDYYPPDHEAIVYQAAYLPNCDPEVSQVPIGQLESAELTYTSTLYIPPVGPPTPDPAMYDHLGFAMPA